MSKIKKIFLILAMLTIPLFVFADSSVEKSTCSFNGIKLYGKYQVVDAFPDIKVQIVDAFPDLKVKQVDAFPNSCGEWQRVDAFPDFKIQFVSAFPDVKIKYVDAFPGVD